jgi:hypothetical protein
MKSCISLLNEILYSSYNSTEHSKSTIKTHSKMSTNTASSSSIISSFDEKEIPGNKIKLI